MIVNRINEWAHSQGAKTALIHNDSTISYATFARAIEAARRFFAQQDLPAGQTAIVLEQNLANAWVFVLALRALGLTTNSVESIAQAQSLKLRNVACLVVFENEREAQNLQGGALANTKIIAVPRSIFDDIQSGDLPPLRQENVAFGGHILFTSGTTGIYKKVLLAGALEEKRNAARADNLSFDSDTIVHLFTFPLWTGAGFKQPTAAWYVGGCVVLDQIRDIADKLSRHRINRAYFVPSMLKDLLQTQMGRPQISGDQIEFAIIGGIIPLNLAERVIGELNSKLSIHYSSTESGRLIAYTPFNTKDDLYWYMPVAGRTIQIVDDLGNECPTGQEGRLRVLREEIDCDSYLDDDEASARVFRDGFFYPGDLAVKRADGRVRIVGRADEVLNIQGRKTAIAPNEQAILNFLQVDEVCLFSGLNNQGIEELVVAIQTDRELPQSELDAVARNFASFERVRFAVMKEFPRAEFGMRKVQRAKLRQMVLDDT